MKRAPALIPLSREHNTAMILAREACRAAANRDSMRIRRAWQRLSHAWHTEMAQHFQAEEAVLFPILRASGAHRLVQRLVREHAAMRRVLNQPNLQDTVRLHALGRVLTEHVRREEREAFPLLQSQLDPQTLRRTGRDIARIMDHELPPCNSKVAKGSSSLSQA